MLDFRKWPPTEADLERIKLYDHYEKVFDGNYLDAFAEGSCKVQEGEDRQYCGADWAKLVSLVSSDLLFGERPIFSAGPDQEQLNALVHHCDLFNKLYESSTSASFRGDAILRLVAEEGQVNVYEIPAYNYFVELDPDNGRKVLSEAVAWVRRIDEDTAFLRVDHHYRGRIVRQAFRFSSGRFCDIPGSQQTLAIANLADAYPDAELPPLEEELTGMDRSALFHIPNWRHGSRYFGFSDYAGSILTLFDSYNERLSEIHRILSEHADPKVLVPDGVLDEEGEIPWKDRNVIEIPSEYSRAAGDAFRYLVWEGQLHPAFQELEKLADLIYKFTETSPAIFGEDKAGSIESARAMKFRFTRTLSRISRKRNYWDRPIKDLLWWLQVLAARLRQVVPYQRPDGTITTIQVEEPTAGIAIGWQDGLPQDDKEQTETESMRVQNGLTSRLKAIQRIDQVSEAEAQRELDRITAEKDVQGVTDGFDPGTATGPGDPDRQFDEPGGAEPQPDFSN